MMILRTPLPSPFGRKVRIAADLLGFAGKIDVQNADLNDPADSIRVQNPVGKVPVLIAEDGTAFYDSRVIVEYLDHLSGGGHLIPRDTKARFDVLRLQALCDGILDAALLQVYEARYRPADMHVESWLERQAGKVGRGLAVLEAAPPKLQPAIDNLPNIGQITLACALGYLDLRFAGVWRKDYPNLVAWLDDFAAQVPAFAETKATA
ncbi:MAG: glutathione S-transferase family protein [Pseudolabrys sp.]|nr:glutathione S-transferase family protein [Pseudolabrys sp.]